jgi:hypothetical protein
LQHRRGIRSVKQRVTVILPRLSGWIPQLAAEDRFPALETVLARSDVGPPLASHPDPLRMKLFGLEGSGEVPVAALSRLAAGSLSAYPSARAPADVSMGLPGSCVRMDPAILQADLNRVVLMRTGFAGFPKSYQEQVREIVGQVLAAEAQAAEADDQGWVLPLISDPDLPFMSVDEALGMDIADSLPAGPAGQYWKKLQNEIQMALHASVANQLRRQAGEAVINAVWFWGQGSLPAVHTPRPFDRVHTQDPVSSGLALLHDCELQSLQVLANEGDLFAQQQHQTILLDWAIPLGDAQAASQACTPHRLDRFCSAALGQLKRQGGVLELHSPERSWHLPARHLWRIWRRSRPLAQQLASQLNSGSSDT